MTTTTRAGKKMPPPAFLAVDFFCGAGGTSRGLIEAGGYVIAGVDKDQRCERTFVDNNQNDFIDYTCPRYLRYDIFPRTDEYTNGQQHLLEQELDGLIAYYRGKVPTVPMLFAICAPCQPFTRLSRKELSEKRKEGRERDSNLLHEACKFVARFRPEMVLSENVEGIKHPSFGGVWDAFRSELEALGYVTGAKVVCTSNFGVAQFRRRSILLAARRECVKRDRLADILGNEMLVPEADSNAPYLTVREVLKDLPPIRAGEVHPDVPNHRTRALSDLNLRRLSCAKPGKSNAYLENTDFGDLSLDCHRKVNGRLKDRCFGDVYTRMNPDRPAPTITTKCHSISNGRFGHYDVNQVRGLSLREAALLQSFPMNYVFYPDDQIEPVARMIGNAVPPKLAQFFAAYLAESVSPVA